MSGIPRPRSKLPKTRGVFSMTIRLTHISLAATLCLLASTSPPWTSLSRWPCAHLGVRGQVNSLSDSFAPVSPPATVVAQINGVTRALLKRASCCYPNHPFDVPEQKASITGSVSCASTGDVDYQFGGKAWGNALYGRMSAQAQGTRNQCSRPRHPYPWASR